MGAEAALLDPGITGSSLAGRQKLVLGTGPGLKLGATFT